MHHVKEKKEELRSKTSPHSPWLVCLLSCTVPMLCLVGCSSNSVPASANTPQSGPQNYFAPYVAGTNNAGGKLTLPQQYSFDHSADTFSQSTFQLSPPSQNGAQVITAGTTAILPRGLLNLGITISYLSTPSGAVATHFNPPKPGSWAVELPDQTGGLVQLLGQPVTPLVAATQCPNLTTAQPYQFLTIPAASGTGSSDWNPATQTAFGSVDISSNGLAVYFNNIKQSTLPSVGGSGVPALPWATSVTGACAPTFFGNTISLPGQAVITNPGIGTVTPQATVGIGPSGLLVEDNGSFSSGGTQLALGAGTGAIGLPKPSGPVDTGTLVSAQYLGFIYGAGIDSNSGTSWSSHIASFGFPAVPTSCDSIAPTTTALIYGSDFNGDDPSTSSYGNCDLAIDLGNQDVANNGLYPNASVWIGPGSAVNPSAKTYFFHAVAIAGLLQGKSVIFLIGVDSTNQPWGIYLMQSTN